MRIFKAMLRRPTAARFRASAAKHNSCQAPLLFYLFSTMQDSTFKTDVYSVPRWYYLWLYPIYLFVRLWQATVRFELPEEDLAQLSPGRRMIVLIWHNRIFITPMLKYRYRSGSPMAGLVSPSKDGAVLSAFFGFFGISTVRGSSRRRGVFAIRDMVNTLKSGCDVCVTPDGPRGPMYEIKRGALKVAELSGEDMLIIRAHYGPHITIKKTWDRFMIPLPFTTVRLKFMSFCSYSEMSEKARAEGMEVEKYVERLLGR